MHFQVNRSTLIATALILSLYGQIPGTPLGLSPVLPNQERNSISRRLSQDRKAEAERLHREGLEQFGTEQFPSALAKFQQALTIYQEIGNQVAVGRTLNNIGMVYGQLKQTDRAIAHLQQALAIHRRIGNIKGEHHTLFNIGKIYR